MVPFSGGGRSAHIATNMSNHMMRSIATKTCIINPRRACAARVIVLCLFVCHCVTVSDTTLQASVVERTLKFRHQRSADDTLECFDLWILLTMLASRDMAKFVSQEAYDRSRSYTLPIIR